MSDNRILTFYPPPGGQFDLMAGLRAWLDHGGRFNYNGAAILEPFNAETHVEAVTCGYQAFEASDLNTLRTIADQFDVRLSLNARWFTPGIQVESYHHADPPIMLWSFDPCPWADEGGLDEADSGLLAFARSAGAAYVLAGMGLGYEVVRHRFVRDGVGYRFVLPPYDPHRGHRMLWVDVCGALGGVEPTGHVEAGRLKRPFGYTRFLLSGTNADIPFDEGEFEA